MDDRLAAALVATWIQQGARGQVPADVLPALVEKTINRAPERPRFYARAVGWHWTITQHRRSVTQVRQERLAALKLAREEAERERREAFEVARAEFYELLARLVPTLPEIQVRWLGMVRLVCFEGVKPHDTAEHFPGISRDARYQWKRRGITLLQPMASDTLLRFLR